MKWVLLFVAVVVLSGCIGIDEPIGKNQNIAFEVVVNNTNLAPNVSGHPPGTGERVAGTLYHTNTSAIQIFVFSHASTAAQTAKMNLSINNTIVTEVELRPLASPEDTHSQITAIIPKNSNYSVNFTNQHHYEWREYPILSGRNGTLSIIQNVTGSSVDNGTIQINESQVTNLTADLNNKVNKSDDTVTGNITFLGNITIFDTKYNMTMQEMNLEYSLVPRFYRNSTLTGTRTSPLATLNMLLATAGTVGNGGGPAIIFWNKENNSEGNAERNIGRVAIVWDNKSLNTTKVQFYARTGPSDTGALTPVLSAYTSQTDYVGMDGFGTGDLLINSTLETGSLKLLNMSGSGNAYVCVNATGTLYRGSPGC